MDYGARMAFPCPVEGVFNFCSMGGVLDRVAATNTTSTPNHYCGLPLDMVWRLLDQNRPNGMEGGSFPRTATHERGSSRRCAERDTVAVLPCRYHEIGAVTVRRMAYDIGGPFPCRCSLQYLLPNHRTGG